MREYDDKQIHAYCVRVLEERDEQLQELIMGKKLTEDNVEEVVVREMCEWTGKKSPCAGDENADADAAGDAADAPKTEL